MYNHLLHTLSNGSKRSTMIMSRIVFQQQKDDEPGESEGVKCFTCGLEEINPHADKVTRTRNEDIAESACWSIQLLETVQTTLNMVLSAGAGQSDRSHGPIMQVQHQ